MTDRRKSSIARENMHFMVSFIQVFIEEEIWVTPNPSVTPRKTEISVKFGKMSFQGFVN